MAATRNPLRDPWPGDLVSSGSAPEIGLVLEVIMRPEKDDSAWIDTDHVTVRIDTILGARRRAGMSLEAWKSWARHGKVLPSDLEPVFTAGGAKAVMLELAKTPSSVEYIHADPNAVCSHCFRHYREHPLDIGEPDRNGNPFLRILCGGYRVAVGTKERRE